MQHKSGFWKHGLLLTLLLGFTVMLVGGAYIYKTRAPIPASVVDSAGNLLFTAGDVQKGQEIFRQYNLMNYGSMLGHGAYLGPDYTAQALHWMTEGMRTRRTHGQYDALDLGQKAAVDAEIAAELRVNRYDAGLDKLTFTAGQTEGWNRICQRTAAQFGADREQVLQPVVLSREQARRLAAFSTWTAWLAVAKRPEAAHSYTNNWPYDKTAGNQATAGALLWSGASVAILLFFLAVILWVQHRWQLSPVDVESPNLRFDVARNPLTPSQRATAKYFVVALALFLVQTLLGGKMAYDYADSGTFYGFDLARYLPFQIARAWHL